MVTHSSERIALKREVAVDASYAPAVLARIQMSLHLGFLQGLPRSRRQRRCWLSVLSIIR